MNILVTGAAGFVGQNLCRALENQQVGLAGPYGLVTDDLKEFRESDGPDVDAIEGLSPAIAIEQKDSRGRCCSRAQQIGCEYGAAEAAADDRDCLEQRVQAL